jgi:hypothetical protein
MEFKRSCAYSLATGIQLRAHWLSEVVNLVIFVSITLNIHLHKYYV